MNVESTIGDCHINEHKRWCSMILLVTNNKWSMLEPIFLQVANNIPTNENEQSQKIQMFVFLILRFEIMYFEVVFLLRSPKKHKSPSFLFCIALLKFFPNSLFIFERFSSNALIWIWIFYFQNYALCVCLFQKLIFEWISNPNFCVWCVLICFVDYCKSWNKSIKQKL